MKGALAVIILCGVAVAVAVGQRDRDRPPAPRAAISWLDDADGKPGKAIKAGGDEARFSLDFRADTDGKGDSGGKLSLRLPGGLEGKIDLPEGMAPDTRFDLDGIGRYPGARLDRVNVDAAKRAAGNEVRVELGFIAPAPAGTVAGWYQEKLAAKGRPVTRAGNALVTATQDGDRMELRFADAGPGQSRGQVLIIDRGRR